MSRSRAPQVWGEREAQESSIISDGVSASQGEVQIGAPAALALGRVPRPLQAAPPSTGCPAPCRLPRPLQTAPPSTGRHALLAPCVLGGQLLRLAVMFSSFPCEHHSKSVLLPAPMLPGWGWGKEESWEGALGVGGWGGAGVIRSIWAPLPSPLWSLSIAASNSGSLPLLCLSLFSPLSGEPQQAHDQPEGHTAPLRPLYRPQREQDSRWCPRAGQDGGIGSVLGSRLSGFAQCLSKAWVGT